MTTNELGDLFDLLDKYLAENENEKSAWTERLLDKIGRAMNQARLKREYKQTI